VTDSARPEPPQQGLIAAVLPYVKPYKYYLLLGLIFTAFLAYLDITIPKYIASLVDEFNAETISGDAIRTLCFWIIGLGIANAISLLLMRYLIIGASRFIECDMNRTLYHKFSELSPTFYDTERTGDLMERATGDVGAVRMFLGPGLMHPTRTIVLLPFALYTMLNVSVFLTLMALVPFVFIAYAAKVFGSAIHLRSRAVQDQMSVLGAAIQEGFSGIRVIKAFRQEATQLDDFNDINGELITRNLAMSRVQAAFFPFLTGMGSLGFLIVVWGGSLLIINDGLTLMGYSFKAITVGELVQFILYLGLLVWPMIALGWSINLYQRGKASMERIQRILHAESLVKDGENLEPIGELQGNVQIKRLSFAYPNLPSIASDIKKESKDADPKRTLMDRREQVRRAREVSSPEGDDIRAVDQHGEPYVLQEINVDLPQGKTLGIVGAIGSGKSSLARLLARFYPVPEGTIFLGGRDINTIRLADLRHEVGFVFQETFLFSDTIMENIRFGRPDASDDEVMEACKVASLHDDIMGFPKQYNTMLGERGINLSGGQKQRAAIARALLYDPSVLILDDSLSAVDTETESSILKALRQKNKDRTVIIIAHRLSTLRDADEIIVLDEGRIVERGKHNDLVTIGGLYAQLWQDQQLAAEIESVV
jgi:ATP-binding cassette subfamily B protein